MSAVDLLFLLRPESIKWLFGKLHKCPGIKSFLRYILYFKMACAGFTKCSSADQPTITNVAWSTRKWKTVFVNNTPLTRLLFWLHICSLTYADIICSLTRSLAWNLQYCNFFDMQLLRKRGSIKYTQPSSTTISTKLNKTRLPRHAFQAFKQKWKRETFYDIAWNQCTSHSLTMH